MPAPIVLDFDDWLRLGVEAGWVTPQFCMTHDGSPATVEEATLESVDDPEAYDRCRFALRVIPDRAPMARFSARWGDDPLADLPELSLAAKVGIRVER